MKIKKEKLKEKKRKNKLLPVVSTGIKKTKKNKIKKILNNTEVAETVKKQHAENQEDSVKRISSRQQLWNKYLVAFYENEKLNKKQKQIMEFCTSKSLTPPKRRKKFLNFIRNCFVQQADVTDEQCNELFDLILKKYVEYKAGTYHNSCDKNLNSVEKKTDKKISKNKKKKLNRSPQKMVKADEEKWEKTRLKKKEKVNEESNEEEMDTSS